MEMLAIVIITEIMYNPASNESAPNDVEWVEIYNPTDEAVDISGWYLKDEDGSAGSIAEGAILEPHTAAVLIPSDQSAEDFHEAWGDDITVYPVDNWGRGGLFNLANAPSPENEVLTLRDSEDHVIDRVNFDDEDGWPSDEPHGPSIYLLPDALDADANDQGSNWQRSIVGQDGAYKVTTTDDFNKSDIGSPGVVATSEAKEEG